MPARLVAMRSLRWLATVCLVAALGACGADAVPSFDLHDPRAVVAAYLRAFTAGDCAGARAYRASATDPLCEGTRLTAYRVENETLPQGSDMVIVATTLTTTGSRDGSIEPGDLSWSYTLARQPDGTWRITGEGQG